MKQRKQLHQPKRKTLAEKFRQEDGAGLVLTLMVLMVLAVLGFAIGAVTIGSHKLSVVNQDSNSAYYIAEAGANMAYEELENEVWFAHENHNAAAGHYFSYLSDKLDVLDGTVYTDFDPQFGDNPKATISIEREPETELTQKYTIVSTGEIAGRTRTVKMPVRVQWQKRGGGLPRMPEDAVMIAKGYLYLDHGVNISGDVYLDGTVDIKLDFVHIDADGVSHVDDSGMIKGEINLTPYIAIFDAFPNNPDASAYEKNYTSNIFSAHTRLSSLNVIDKLIFDTDGKDINLIVDNLTINRDIEIIGGGTVNIYVNNYLSFAAHDLNINWGGAADKLNIFYAGSTPVRVKNNFNFKCTLFLNNSGITFDKDLSMDGIIISRKDVEFKKEGATVVASIFAPEASVKFRKDSSYSGTIVSKIIESNRQSKFYYALNPYLTTYPYGPEPGGIGTGGSGFGTFTIDQLISAQPALEP